MGKKIYLIDDNYLKVAQLNSFISAIQEHRHADLDNLANQNFIFGYREPSYIDGSYIGGGGGAVEVEGTWVSYQVKGKKCFINTLIDTSNNDEDIVISKLISYLHKTTPSNQEPGLGDYIKTLSKVAEIMEGVIPPYKIYHQAHVETHDPLIKEKIAKAAQAHGGLTWKGTSQKIQKLKNLIEWLRAAGHITIDYHGKIFYKTSNHMAINDILKILNNDQPLTTLNNNENGTHILSGLDRYMLDKKEPSCDILIKLESLHDNIDGAIKQKQDMGSWTTFKRALKATMDLSLVKNSNSMFNAWNQPVPSDLKLKITF